MGKFSVSTIDIHVPSTVQLTERLATLGIEVAIFFNVGHWSIFLMLQCFYAPSTVLTAVFIGKLHCRAVLVSWR